MHRRQLIRQSVLAASAFAFSRDIFAMQGHGRSDDPGGMPETGMIRLSSNENPHGPSPLARKAMMDAISISNRYQWDTNALFREQIGKLTGHTRDHITLGAGSSELLGLVSLWAAYKQGNVVAAEPTFKLWMPAARQMGLETKLVPLTATKHNDLQRMLDAIDAQTRMVYLCNPNNPTGTVSPRGELESFIRKVAADRILLLDEAYTEYEDSPSMQSLVDELPNLIVAKTFSKVYGMAGARVGYLLAHPSTIKAINAYQAWANAGPSATSMLGAMAALTDHEFVTYCKQENLKARLILCKGFEKAGIPFIPSSTSFVYFNNQPYPKNIPELLQSNRIMGARSFEQQSSWFRISVGTTEEMQKLVSLL